MTALQAVQAYLDAHYEEGLEDLKAFCRIKSVSTDPDYRDGIHAAAGFVADRLTRAGFDRVARLETGGHPAVYGEITSDPSQPTYLTIIPSMASAKITCRLVTGQKPAHIAETVRRHLEQRLPPGLTLEFHRHGPGSEAFFVNPDLPLLATAEDVLGAVLGQKPLRVAMGATVPIGSAVRKILDRETIFFSFSTSDEDYHAPNEFLRLQNFRIGLSAWSKLLLALGGDAAIAI